MNTLSNEEILEFVMSEYKRVGCQNIDGQSVTLTGVSFLCKETWRKRTEQWVRRESVSGLCVGTTFVSEDLTIP